MHSSYSFRRMAIAAFSLFTFSALCFPAFAQSGAGLDANTLARLIQENQKNGHAPFYHICEQYDIAFDNTDLAAKYQQPLSSGIKGIEGVISCVVDPANNVIHVRFPKETEKVQGPGHIADIKAIMDTYHLRMTGYKQATYQF